MPLQDYKLYTRDEVVGALYGISLTNSVRQSYANVLANGNPGAEVGFGLAVKRTDNAAAGQTRTAALGVNATPDAEGDNAVAIEGLTMRQINKQMTTVPGTGAIAYAPSEVMGVLIDGYIHVEVLAGDTGATNAVLNAPVFVHAANGTIHSSPIAGATVQATNLVFDRNNDNGDIGLVRISQA